MAENKEVKNCPYCDEEILARAVKCKHCKSDLEAIPPVVPPTPPMQPAGTEEEKGLTDFQELQEPPTPPTPVSVGQGPPPVPPLGSEPVSSQQGPGTPQPPDSNRSAESSYTYPKAGLGKRILAYIIDSLICGLPLMFLIPMGVVPFIIYTQTQGQVGGHSAAAPNAAMIIFMVLAVIVGAGWALFYFLLRDGFGKGQSWGKKICGLMVINLDSNSPCDKGKSFLRNIVLWALSALAGLSIIELILILVQDNGSRLGDMLARTQVIEVEHYKI